MDQALEHCVCGAHEKSEFAQLKLALIDARVGSAVVFDHERPAFTDNQLACAVVVLSPVLIKHIGPREIGPNAFVTVSLNNQMPVVREDGDDGSWEVLTRRCPLDHQHTEAHPCPYREEIDGDATTLCTCCEGCTSVCAADI